MMTRFLLTTLILAFFVLGNSSKAWAQSDQEGEVTLQPSKDNTLYEELAGSRSNGVGEHLFVGRTNQGDIRRALLAFDVAGTVPTGSVISSVTLTLSMSMSVSGQQSVGLHRVASDWGEGTSNAAANEGQGAAASTGDATWRHTFFDTDFWQADGGDFASTPSANVQVGTDGSYTWGSTSQMVSDVQGWLDQPETNFGWILIGNENASRTAKRFNSREHGSANTRPMLQITFATSTATEGEGPLRTFQLEGNHPNPFDAVTTISYTLDVPQRVTLEVYDVLGRTVETLGGEWQDAGTHRVSFAAQALPAGIYIYCISGGGARQCQRTAVLR